MARSARKNQDRKWLFGICVKPQSGRSSGLESHRFETEERRRMRIVILGGNGQVGSDLASVLRESNEDVVALSRSEIDVTDSAALRGKLAGYDPDVLINCSVYHPVDECESHP